MNIALIGYGRMGREVEAIAVSRGHTICATIDPNTGSHRVCGPEALEGADGVIEFGLPEGILERIGLTAAAGLPMVVGTTGWTEHLAEAERTVREKGGSLLHGSNFSVGANLFFRVVEEAAALINPFADYDIMLEEAHHRNKTDSPSGTALTIADKILGKNRRKKRISTEVLQRRIEDDELHIASIRGGSIPGIHTVTLDSPADRIVLTHSARNRSGFALGAVQGLEWLADRRGVFTIDDFFNDITKATK
jgi:4-hydroxy-tetrahydrodipicolinate reductase